MFVNCWWEIMQRCKMSSVRFGVDVMLGVVTR
jgi:hypothetical protein